MCQAARTVQKAQKQYILSGGRKVEDFFKKWGEGGGFPFYSAAIFLK